MRIEIGNWPYTRGTKVYLDGVEQKRVRVADDELGIIERLAVDETGKLKVNDQGDGVAIETLHGKVTIVLPEKKAEL